ncbi:MAG: hypothetical protein OCC45_06395 [Desulfotalea sp.]
MENKRQDIIRQIGKLRIDIHLRYNTLNTEAIWLFVATLSCWSVDVKVIKIIALALVLFIFTTNVWKNSKNAKTFTERSKHIRAKINESQLTEDQKKVCKYDLDKLEKTLLTFKQLFQRTPVFLSSYIFWIITVFYIVWDSLLIKIF